GDVRYAVSRCTLTDIDLAVAANEAPTFNKWNGEALADAWTEPALGGEAQSIPGEILEYVTGSGDFLTLPTRRHLWIGPEFDSVDTWAVSAAEVSDPLTFGDRIPLLTGQTTREYIYGTVWSGNPDAPKNVDS